MSISVRGIMRRYASLEPGGRGGSVKLTRISPGKKLVRPGPAGTFSTGSSRRPFGPCTVTMAPAATIAGTLSPAGEPLQRLPPAEARPCTCLEPIRLIASSTPGQTLPNCGWSCSTMPETAAPIAKPAVGGLLDRGHLGDLLDVDDHARLHGAGAHLHQKIGAAGQDARCTSGCGEGLDRFIKRVGRQISEYRSCGSAVSLSSRRR